MSKKALFILIISIVCSFSAKAQKDTLVYYMRTYRVSETMTFDGQVQIKDSAEFYRVILPRDTNSDKNLFMVVDYYKDGKTKMMGKSIDQSYQLPLEGACIEFFPNGHRKSIKNFEGGKLLGDVTAYFPNGKLYLIGSYAKNSKLIISKCRDSTGKTLAENGNGHCIKYDHDFKRIYAEGDILNGLEEGVWHGFLEDSARYICTYEKGISKKGIGYDKKGGKYPFTTTDVVLPHFDEFSAFLARNIHYPAVAKENDIQGIVYINFAVNKDGQLSDLKIIRGIGSGCDEEVMRVMKVSSPWVPGYQFGMPVRVPYTLPISFTLSGNY